MELGNRQGKEECLRLSKHAIIHFQEEGLQRLLLVTIVEYYKTFVIFHTCQEKTFKYSTVVNS